MNKKIQEIRREVLGERQGFGKTETVKRIVRALQYSPSNEELLYIATNGFKNMSPKKQAKEVMQMISNTPIGEADDVFGADLPEIDNNSFGPVGLDEPPREPRNEDEMNMLYKMLVKAFWVRPANIPFSINKLPMDVDDESVDSAIEGLKTLLSRVTV